MAPVLMTMGDGGRVCSGDTEARFSREEGLMDSGPHPWVSNPLPEAGEEEAPSVPWPRLTSASLAKSHCFPKLWPVEPHTETFVPPGRLVLACEAPVLLGHLATGLHLQAKTLTSVEVQKLILRFFLKVRQ